MPLGKKVEDLSKEAKDALRQLAEDFEKEDKEIRENQVRLWKKLEEYWHGLQMIFWSERDQTWISPDSVQFEDVFSPEEISQLGPIYDYVVDIYKAHGESIIAALAANIPPLKYRPDDADDESDRMTARTYTKIAELLYIHNKAKMIFLQGLFFIYNAGNVFSYRYTETNPSFGTYTVPKMEPKETLVCEDCGSVREPNILEPCQQCGSDTPPKISATAVVAGEEVHPKTRVKIDTFGPLHVKIPYYPKTQSGCGYLQLKTDQHRSLLISIYIDLEDDIKGAKTVDSSDRYARSSYTYPHEVEDVNMELVTIEKTWLRPWTFYGIPDKAIRKELLDSFPRGCQVTFIGQERVFAEAFNESMDDRWEIGQSGISPTIHTDPLGKVLVGPQDMRNELVNLTMDTIDHGIPAVYADSEVIEFDQYGRFESQPGVIYKAKARPGQSLRDAFAEEPRSTMSKEHMLFFRQIDQDAQFASGDFPAIHGGPSEGKSRTLGEYAMSKQMALQRLTIIWELYLDWWIRTLDGAVRLYAETVITDQAYSKQENNNYINVWIRRSEMEGKVGGVEPEGGGNFPVSIVQKRDVLFRLMELNNPQINAALYTPTNARLLKDGLALEDLVLPGEDQRVKQAREINDMIKTDQEPTPDGQGGFTPTVDVDPDVDDHAVHIAVLKTFLVSTIGLDLKDTNPMAYVNLIAHLRAHQYALAQQTQMQYERTAPGEAPDSGASTTEGE